MEFLRRFLSLFQPAKTAAQKGEWPDNVGPDPDEMPVVKVTDVLGLTLRTNVIGKWDQGWYEFARRTPAHPGRVGRGIVPKTLIVHTTDCKPGTFNAILKSWTTQPGKGNGAHFMLGKSEKDGMVQFVPITKNGNHAGGPNCGGFKSGGMGTLINPNVVSVGIELDNAGRLTKDAKGWYHKDTGYRFAAADVFIDEKGRGWEKVTEYQLAELKRLWLSLKPSLAPWPSGTTVVPNGSYAANGSQWAVPASPALTAHASTNAINKTDPGPQVMAEMNKWL